MLAVIIGEFIFISLCCYIIALTYGKNPFKNTKSILPALVKDKKYIRWFFILLIVFQAITLLSGLLS
jgi:hypothetical protein